MIIHRMSTQAPEPPVRFYKGIALSFLFLTIILLGVVIFITTKKVAITIFAKQDPETISFTVDIGGQKSESIKGKVESAPFYYAADFTPTGNSQVEDVARGKVKLFNKTSAPQTLVKTTRLVTPTGVLFRLSDKVTVPANGEIMADVYADKKGAISNVQPTRFTIPGLSDDKQKVIYAESSDVMSGGMKNVGSLTSEDLENAKNEYKKKAEAEFLKTLPSPEEGIERLVSVIEDDFASDKIVGDVVASFKISGTSTMVVAEYKKDDLNSIINKEASERIDKKSEKYLSLTSNPKVTIQSFNVNDETAVLIVRQEVAVTLDGEGEGLAPEIFFGKQKDEIERYIMALDHVSGVEVKFTPSWVSSAPASSDRITILLKNIK